MIDCDVSNSTLRHLVWKALKEYETQILLPMLQDTDAIVRTAVARELQVRGGDDVFTVAIELTNALRFEGREIAAFLLGQLGTPDYPYRDKSIPYLRKLLLDDYYEVRGIAASSLGWLHAHEAVCDLIALACDSEAYVREGVAFALGRLNPNPEIRLALEKLADDDHPDVREWAELSLEMCNS